MPERILIVDDEPDIRELIGEILDDEGFQTDLAADAEAARRQLAEHPADLVLLDVWMPGCDGVTLLKEWRERGELHCPVVMISGHGSVEAAVEATRNGAFDFIEKPVSMARLLATIKRALSEGRREAPIGAVPAESEGLEPIGRSPAIERVREAIDELCSGAAGHLLIEGEAGSGCTSLARWVHSQGGGGRFEHRVCDRDGEGLAACRALLDREDPPRTLYLDRLHQLEAAGLDRLGDLLSRIESRDDRAIRLIASKHPGSAGPTPAQLTKIGPFRVQLPALRERAEDIPDLVRLLSERLPSEEGLTYRPIPLPAQNRLRQYEWPGNLAELVDVIRGLLDGREEPVDVDDVEAALARAAREESVSATLADSPLFQLPLREAREAFERQYLIARLRQVGGSVGQLADAVEMERTHLYRKLKQLGIDPKRIQEETA